MLVYSARHGCFDQNAVMTMSKRAVFLDRDGVLNANLVRDGHPYAPRTLEEFRLLPGVEEAVQRAKEAGFMTIIATNQPDVPSGITPRATVDAMHAELRRRLPVDDIRICFHTDADHCDCRKPKPGLLLAAAAEHGIDLTASYFVGDRWRDVDAGRAAGCFTILVDHGLVQDKPTHPHLTVASLDEAVSFILARDER
jgi:D-glycero-D-manno-heptose 1,7-bisphosphate phosphatase